MLTPEDEERFKSEEIRAWERHMKVESETQVDQIKFRIWSQEHGAWWAPDKMGYTRDYMEAGKYAMEEAINIVAQANKHLLPGQPANEIGLLVVAVI